MHNGSTHWLPPFQPWFVADALLQFYGYQWTSALVLGSVAVILIAARPGAARTFWQEAGVRTLWTTFAVCLATPLAVSIFKPIYYPARYSTIALPALVVLLGGMWTRLAPRPMGLALGYVLVLASAGSYVMNGGVTAYAELPPNQSDRTTAEYLVSHAAPGDAVVFTSLTRAAADYYLRRLGAEGRFVETSFPHEIDRHVGWRDAAAMLRHPAALEQEASELAGRLGRLGAGHRVRLYYGADRTVSDFLKKRLDAALPQAGRHDLQGPFHTQLLVYQAGGSVRP